MNPDAPCHCAHQVNLNVERGVIDPGRLRLVGPREREGALTHVREVRTLIDSLELYRRHTSPTAPDGLVEGLKTLLHSGQLPYFH